MIKGILAIKNVMFWGTCFAVVNITMFLALHKYWIGGVSFLPLVGVLGPGKKLLFALVVQVGVIVGALLGALLSGEFILRLPSGKNTSRAVLGGVLMGIGSALAPGSCSGAFISNLPLLSVAAFLSITGIFIGGYLAYKLTWKG